MSYCWKFTITLLLCGFIPGNRTGAQTWKEMNASKKESLEWFNEAKFGMFVHFGLYSIPGGIWKGRKMEEMERPWGPFVAEWIMWVGKIPREEYKQLTAQFNPVKFDADEWVRLASDAGMRYLLITSKHADGFALWDSEVTDYDIGSTPFKRDVLVELQDACDRYGIKLCLYYCQNMDWMDAGDCDYQFYDDYYEGVYPESSEFAGQKINPYGANLYDPSPNTFQEYLCRKAYPQVKEILTRYPGLGFIWYDAPIWMTREQSFRFYRLTYRYQPGALVNSRVGNGYGDFLSPDDNRIPEAGQTWDRPWETVGSMNNSWGYKSYDQDWKSTGELLYWLVDIASKGGNYTLNIGPRADGTIPEESVQRLHEIGKWMKTNGEAVYGTTRWKTVKEGPTNYSQTGTKERRDEGFTADFTPDDIWFTSKGNLVYAIALKSPDNAMLTIKSLKDEPVKRISLLGSVAELSWKRTDTGVRINLPGIKNDSHGYVLKVELENE